jgi:hypothetical protein
MRLSGLLFADLGNEFFYYAMPGGEIAVAKILDDRRMNCTLPQRRMRAARADFDNIVTRTEQILKDEGIPVGEDYVKRWFAAESLIDPQLRDAFDHRYDSPQHLKRANHLVDKARQRMISAARSQPDPEATANRYAVAAAVRGASGIAPPEKPPRYGDMSEAEFAREKKKFGL